MAADDLIREVTDVRFTPVRMREGYDMSEVDYFLDQVVAALEAGTPIAPLIENARFTPVRMREGYEMGDVDDFLARIAEQDGGNSSEVAADDETPWELSDDPAVPQDASDSPSNPSRPAYPEVIKEHRGWWSRVFGSRDR